MSSNIVPKIVAIVFLCVVGYSTIPGCIITIGPGTDDGAEGSTSGGNGADSGTLTEVEMAQQAYANLAPQELALASAKASVTTYALAGTLDSLPLDPTTLDDAMVAQLMQQYGPAAADQTEAWLATIDPTTLPLIANNPRYDCTDKWGCAYQTTCKYNYFPASKYLCFVNDCGDARCGTCPDWVVDALTHLVLKAWCSYICVEANVYKPKVVAVGAGGVSTLFGDFVGPICFAPP